MMNPSPRPSRPEDKLKRGGFSASALSVSIAIALFAVVTQLLDANGAISLSTTQQLTTWLVALGLIVLLWIAYMVCSAYLTARSEWAEAEKARTAAAEADTQRDEALMAKDATEQELKDAKAKIAEARQEAEKARTAAAEADTQRDEALKAKDATEQELKVAKAKIAELLGAELPVNQTDGPFAHGPAEDESPGDTWVPPHELRHLDGQGRLVSTREVFPYGCYLEPDSISQAVGKLTGQPVYQCKVVDPNPALKGPHDTVVYILTDQKPSPPTGLAFEPVEFDHLVITPYVSDPIPTRVAYTLCASGIHPVRGEAETPGEHVQAMG